MSAEQVGQLYAELGIKDVTLPQLREAEQNFDRWAHRMGQIPDPAVGVDTSQVRPELEQMEHRLRAVTDDDYTVTPNVDVSHVDDGAGEGRARVSDMVSGWAAAAVVAAGAIGAAAGKELVDQFMDWAERDAEGDRLGAALGLNDWASARYGKIAGEIYAGAWGDSFEEVTGALKFGANNKLFDFGSTDEEISTVTERLLDLAGIFEQDIPDLANAAGQLIRNGMARDTWEALDILTTGFQKGLDRNGDFLDSFSEYPALFQALGVQGPAALGMIDQLLGSGARNTDLAADAIKEFTIRSKDGSAQTRDAMRLLGLDADDVARRLAEGGDVAAGAFDDVLDRIRGIKDPLDRGRVQVQLFGTQSEDLQKALDALDPSNATDAIGDVAGAAEKASERVNDNIATDLESLQRRSKMAVEDYLGGLWTAYQDGGVDGLMDSLEEDVDQLNAWWDQNGDRITEGLSAWWETSGEPLVGEVGASIAGALWDGLEEAWWNSLNGFVDDVHTLWEYLWDDYGLDLKDSFIDGLKIGAGEIEDMFVEIPNAFVDALNFMIDAWNEFELKLPSFDGLEIAGQTVIPGWEGPALPTPNLEHLPHFDRGGPVLAPEGSAVLAVIHGGEYVQTGAEKNRQDAYIAQLERQLSTRNPYPLPANHAPRGNTINYFMGAPSSIVRNLPWTRIDRSL